MNRFFTALIEAIDRQTRNQESCLTGPGKKSVPGKAFIRREDLIVRPKTNSGTRLFLRDFSNRLQSRLISESLEGRIWRALTRIIEFAGLSSPETHLPSLTTTVDLDVHSRRKSIHNRGTDTVETARGSIGAVSKLSTSMKLGEDDFHARKANSGDIIYGNTTTIISNRS